VAPGYDPVEKGGAVLAAADAQRGERTAQARMVYQPVQCERQAVSLTVNHVVNALVCARRGRGASHRDSEIDGRRPRREVHERGPVVAGFRYGSIQDSWRMSIDRRVHPAKDLAQLVPDGRPVVQVLTVPAVVRRRMPDP